jgi:membrane protein YdbS with pleckstrin-like domain
MPEKNARPAGKATFGIRNRVVLGLAIGTLVGGYFLLASGSASAAAVVLVLGYVVLFPLAIAI